jgi:hypothetical protein
VSTTRRCRRLTPARPAPSGAGGERPDPAAWARALARATLEVYSGARPAGDLARWLSDDVYTSLRRRGRLAARTGGPCTRCPKVHTVACRHPSPDTVEVAALLDDGARLRALAMRLDWRGGRWLATDLRLL